jgi:monoamine oxidase
LFGINLIYIHNNLTYFLAARSASGLGNRPRRLRGLRLLFGPDDLAISGFFVRCSMSWPPRYCQIAGRNAILASPEANEDATGMARGDVEVVIIGGGAAGIAAARRLRAAGVDALLIEARRRLGGRAWTVAAAGGLPLDLGCSWLHSADRNPWAPIAAAQGCAIDKSPPPWTRPSAPAGLSASEMAAFGAALRSFRDRVDSIAPDEIDRSAAAFLAPQERWNNLLNAVSTWYSGAELDLVSARDLARYDDSGVNWRVAEGYGRVIAAHAADAAIALDCKAERIDGRGGRLRVETTQGAIVADAVIVTLSSNLIAAQPDLFLPALAEKTEAAAGLPLGLADKLFLSLADAGQFDEESRAFGDAGRTATAAYQFRPFGRPMIEAYFGGALAADLEKGGKAAFFDFAVAELTGLFGADFSRRVKPLGLHCWGSDPLARGSYSYALPGKAGNREALAAPVDGRIFFAGEACSPTDFSTAHGAFLTGVAAADQAIAALRGKPPSSRQKTG